MVLRALYIAFPGAAFGEVHVLLFVAGAAFGEVHVSFFLAGAAFGEIWRWTRVRKLCFGFFIVLCCASCLAPLHIMQRNSFQQEVSSSNNEYLISRFHGQVSLLLLFIFEVLVMCLKLYTM